MSEVIESLANDTDQTPDASIAQGVLAWVPNNAESPSVLHARVSELLRENDSLKTSLASVQVQLRDANRALADRATYNRSDLVTLAASALNGFASSGKVARGGAAVMGEAAAEAAVAAVSALSSLGQVKP